MSSGRQEIHAALVELMTSTVGTDTRVRENADTPNDWDAEEMRGVQHVLIVRHGGFTRKVITGKIDWYHAPIIEGHTRAENDAALAVPSDALLAAVVNALDEDRTLNTLCADLSLQIDDDPEPNTSVLEAGSMLTWKLKLFAHVEERTQGW